MSGLLNSGVNGSTSNLPDTTGRPFTSSFSAQSGSNAAVFNHSGNLQELHSIHGNFNIPNMPGAFASRNSTMNGGLPSGVQQPDGSLSNGRFAINSLPNALSQLSHASLHGHSGFTNRGGSGVSPILVNTGRITNSMGNLVSGANNARGLSSGGGLSMPAHASHSNLTAPQMISMLGNSYSTGGGRLSQNQVQAGNNHLTSMTLLNELSAHEIASFDINDFPRLTGRPNSAGGSQGQLGLMQKPSVGLLQQNQEFSIQNEDFPALPGFKGGNSDFPVDMHQKEQRHDNVTSMMQSQHLPIGRFAGFSSGGPYSSHHQQQQQHVSSVIGGELSFLPANNQDLHFHDSEARSMGPPSIGLRPINSSNTVFGSGSYDQLIQQYQQLQSQSQFRLRQMLAVSPFRDKDMKSTQASQAVTDRFGLLGLLSVIRMSNPDLTSLALGIDLTTLGLNLNSSENLHRKFASPWSEEPAKGEPQYSVPECYYAKQPPALNRGYFSNFQPETLFYIFYSMPKEEAQLYAANELHTRGWFYHRELRLWLKRVTNMEPLVKTSTYERGSYICFDPNKWETAQKDNFVLQYEKLEKRPTLPLH